MPGRHALAAALVAVAMNCSVQTMARAQDDPTSEFVYGVGVIIAIDGSRRNLTISHEEIKTFMSPMEKMTYPVARESLLIGLKKDDKIEFSIRRKNGTIENIRIRRPAP